MTLTVHAMAIEGPIEPDRWGKDHKSTLLYAETRAVDHRGVLDFRQMRTGNEYPTRLLGDVQVAGHTDYDCLTDARLAGLLRQHPTENDDRTPVIFTRKGWAYVHRLRREKAQTALTRSAL